MALVQSPPSSPSHSPFAAPSSFNLPPRPLPQRRPSALRSTSSDHLITPGVTRFNHRLEEIPREPQRSTSQRSATAKPSLSREPSSKTHGRMAPPIPTVDSAPKRSSPPPVRPPPQPLGSSTSGGSSGSLLARRRSSRSAVRSDIPSLSELSLGDLPTTPLAELDDTVRPKVIGESSHAVTPVSDSASSTAGGARVVEKPYKSTKAFVPTPFPQRRKDWLDDEDEDDEDEKQCKDEAVPAEDLVKNVVDNGEWLPLQESAKKA
ncbi:hypothetical protein JCM10207_008810 [Rhodosporidiobolus poonsookiae]